MNGWKQSSCDVTDLWFVITTCVYLCALIDLLIAAVIQDHHHLMTRDKGRCSVGPYGWFYCTNNKVNKTSCLIRRLVIVICSRLHSHWSTEHTLQRSWKKQVYRRRYAPPKPKLRYRKTKHTFCGTPVCVPSPKLCEELLPRTTFRQNRAINYWVMAKKTILMAAVRHLEFQKCSYLIICHRVPNLHLCTKFHQNRMISAARYDG